VYESEHNFTVSELRKVAKTAKQNNEIFDFLDHYSSNTSVFKQNLVTILEMFGTRQFTEVETIWNAKFQKVYASLQDQTPEEINGTRCITQRTARSSEQDFGQTRYHLGNQYLLLTRKFSEAGLDRLFLVQRAKEVQGGSGVAAGARRKTQAQSQQIAAS
jgi:hypothetical protein